MNWLRHHFTVIKKRVSTHPALNKSVVKKIKLSPCALAEKMHKDRWRFFAHTFHKGSYAICYAKELENLSDKYIKGILWHEFGHILAKKGTEAGANEIIRKLFGITIKYDRENNNLEYI